MEIAHQIALNNIYDLLFTEVKPEVERTPIVIETHVFAKNGFKKYMLASEEEFEQIRADTPELNIRKPSEEELKTMSAIEGDEN